jgi:single-strand DNA-binding protein
MVHDAYVFLAGYVATDPEYVQTPGKPTRTVLRVAYTPRRQNRDTGEWTDAPTSFVRVTCWRKLAEHAALCLRKGEPVLIRGRMQVRRFDGRDGNPRMEVEIDASSVGHDLSRGLSLYQRIRRVSTDSDGSGPAAASAAARAGEHGAAGNGRAELPGERDLDEPAEHDPGDDDLLRGDHDLGGDLDDHAVAALTGDEPADPDPFAGGPAGAGLAVTG